MNVRWADHRRTPAMLEDIWDATRGSEPATATATTRGDARSSPLEQDPDLLRSLDQEQLRPGDGGNAEGAEPCRRGVSSPALV